MTQPNHFAVLKPVPHRDAMQYDVMTPVRCLAALPVWVPFAFFAVALLWPTIAAAQSGEAVRPFNALWRWAPFLITKGFFFNILISFLCLLIGTFVGVLLGLGQISLLRPIRAPFWNFARVEQ